MRDLQEARQVLRQLRLRLMLAARGGAASAARAPAVAVLGASVACTGGAGDPGMAASDPDVPRAAVAAEPYAAEPYAAEPYAAEPYAAEPDAAVPSAAPRQGTEVDVAPASPAEFRAPWCEGPGLDPRDRLVMMDGIARDYELARAGDCASAGLILTSSERQRDRWHDYLTGYSAALAGCPPLPVEVPGGILEFGPANTAVIGLPPPRLGPDDVAVLISKFMTAFAGALALSEGERSVVEAHLWSTAEPEIDPDIAAALSTCP